MRLVSSINGALDQMNDQVDSVAERVVGPKYRALLVVAIYLVVIGLGAILFLWGRGVL